MTHATGGALRGAQAAQPTRSELLRSLQDAPRRDLVVIGGGATGLGVALDAAARGYFYGTEAPMVR